MDISQIKTIAIIGRSEKFIGVLSTMFPNAKIKVIPWRKCEKYAMRELESNFLTASDLIVVCGYDYASALYKYDDYCEVNIDNPLDLVKKLTEFNESSVLYITTATNKTDNIYSRYEYAKNMLGMKLNQNCRNFYPLSIPTVTNSNGNADVYGGWVSKFIFNKLIQLNIVRTISHAELRASIIDVLSGSPVRYCSNKIGKNKNSHLKLRRTLFIDRLLRFLGA
ncbi:hypothetical protein G6717_06110 [Polynucleobacter paneuropaeus]|nr:hypothetical protein [Polynucleobacter paneuropaeus]